MFVDDQIEESKSKMVLDAIQNLGKEERDLREQMLMQEGSGANKGMTPRLKVSASIEEIYASKEANRMSLF